MCQRCGEHEAESVDGYCPECVRIRLALRGAMMGLSALMGPASKHFCHYCPKRARTWDHVVPRALKGPDEKWNLVPACKSCNQSKAHLPSDCRCPFCEAAWERWAAQVSEIGSLKSP